MMICLALIALVLSSLPTTGAPRKDTAPLDGRWTGPCMPMGKNGRHGTIARLTIAGDRIEAVAQTYAHASCDIPTITTRLAGTVVARAAAGTEIDAALRVRDVTLRPDHADVVAIWNRDRETKHCGSHLWQLNEAQSTAGQECVPGLRFPTRGERLAVVLSYDGATIRIDNPLTGSDAAGDQATIVFTRDAP